MYIGLFYEDKLSSTHLSISSADETVNAPPSSKLRCVMTQSSMSMAYLRLRRPRPLSVKSSSTPSSLANFADPSASMRISPCVPTDLLQASITKASFTLTHATSSTPFSRNVGASLTNPGRCLVLHVGVNAPGTAKSTTFFPAKSSRVVTSRIFPSSSKYESLTSGSASPSCTVFSRTISSHCSDDDDDGGDDDVAAEMGAESKLRPPG